MRKLIFFLFACSLFVGCNVNTSDQSEKFQSTDAAAMSEEYVGDSVKLVKSAGIRFKVKDVEKSTQTISTLTRSFGGMINHYQFDAIEDGSRTLPSGQDSLKLITRYTPEATINVRVPSDNLEKYLFSLADIGYHTNSSSLEIDDRSLAYLQHKLRYENRNDALTSSNLPNNKSNDLLKKIDVKDDMIDQHIANKSIDHDVKYSIVRMTLYQNSMVSQETIVNTDLSSYTTSYSDKFGNAFKSGWEIFLQLILVVVNLWMFIVLALVGWIGFQFFRKRAIV